METDIILVAKQLIEQGKIPTVATVKGRLPRRVAIPVIIKVLQKISGMSVEQLATLVPQAITTVADLPATSDETVSLQHDVKRLSEQLQQVKEQLNLLTQQFEQHLPKSDKT